MTDSLAPHLDTLEMRNGLIVSIPIGHYDPDPLDPEIPGKLKDLTVENDAVNLRNLATFLEYKFMTIDDKLSWKEQEVMAFLKEKVGAEFFDDEGVAKYDGLIVSMSCHGVRNHIVTSDYKV